MGSELHWEDASSEEDLAEDEQLVPPLEACRHNFREAKRRLKFADDQIAEKTELVTLRNAAEIAEREILLSGRPGYHRGLEEAADGCRVAVATLDKGSRRQNASPEKDSNRTPLKTPAGLDLWRPDFSAKTRITDATPANEPTQEVSGDGDREETATYQSEADVHAQVIAPEVEPADLDELADQKKDADKACRDGDYATALRIYETLLEDDKYTLSPELHVSVACNAALCTLKLTPELMGPWSRTRGMLRRTISHCDTALNIDSANSKAHFRKGSALEILEDYPAAFAEYSLAAQFAPGDPLIIKAQERVQLFQSYEGDRDEDERLVKARARLLEADPSWQRWKREVSAHAAKRNGGRPAAWNGGSQPSRDDRAGPCILSACCACGSDGARWYASPCGHGPFCDGCRKRVDAKGQLRLCPQCKRKPAATAEYGIITVWRCEGDDVYPERNGSGESYEDRKIQAAAAHTKHEFDVAGLDVLD